MAARDWLLAEAIRVRTEIDTFIDQHSAKLDGELWEAMELESKYLRHDIELLDGPHLTDSGLELVANRIGESDTWFQEQQKDLLELLAS